MSRIPSHRRSCLFLALLMAVCLPLSAMADDESAGQAEVSTSQEGGGQAETAIELVDRLRDLRRQTPAGETREEMLENYKKTQQEALQVAGSLYEKTIAGKTPDLSLAELAVQAKFQALMILAQIEEGNFPANEFIDLANDGKKLYEESKKDQQDGLQIGGTAMQIVLQSLGVAQQLGDKEADAQRSSFVKMISEDPRPQIAAIGKQLQVQLKFQIPQDADPATIDKLAKELKEEFSNRAVAPDDLEMIMNLLNGVEMLGQYQTAARLNEFFAKKLAESKQEQLKQLAGSFEGAVRRLELPGHEMELSGTFLDGTKLDWASYRGKVVLIDFWATWCGPCRAELPNLLANYEKYHAQGFDVIGINMDDGRQTVETFLEKEKLPWKTLFSDKPGKTGFGSPMAQRYGIMGIPTVILVDREGKVVSLQARGEELGKLLAEQFDGDKDPAEEES